VCEIGYAHGVDLWNYEYKDKDEDEDENGVRSISKAIDYVFPALRNPYNPESAWKHRQISPSVQADKLFLHFGAVRLNRPELRRLNNSLGGGRRYWRERYICPLCLMEGYEM